MGHKGLVSGCTIFTSILRFMSDQRDPRVLRCHSLVSEHKHAIT